MYKLIISIIKCIILVVNPIKTSLVHSFVIEGFSLTEPWQPVTSWCEVVAPYPVIHPKVRQAAGNGVV